VNDDDLFSFVESDDASFDLLLNVDVSHFTKFLLVPLGGFPAIVPGLNFSMPGELAVLTTLAGRDRPICWRSGVDLFELGVSLPLEVAASFVRSLAEEAVLAGISTPSAMASRVTGLLRKLLLAFGGEFAGAERLPTLCAFRWRAGMTRDREVA
jgi:hypothetical protein